MPTYMVLLWSAFMPTFASAVAPWRAITRVATPESQDYLLMIARHGTASHVEKLVRAYRSVERLHEAAHARSTHAQRALRWGFEDDGSMTITVRLPAEQGALVVQAIHAAVDAQWRERDGADRELDSAAMSPMARDVSAETSCLSRPPRTASTTPNRPFRRAAPMRCVTSRSTSSRARP